MKRKGSYISLLIKVSLLGILLNITIADAKPMSPSLNRVDAWLKYKGKYNSRIYDAAIVKSDKSIIPDLKQFLELADPGVQVYAKSVFALAKLGEPGMEDKFNEILLLEFDATKDKSNNLHRAKCYTLNRMFELEMKPSKEATDSVEQSILETDNIRVLRLATALKPHINGFSVEVTDHLRKLITYNWPRIRFEDVNTLSIQPDWETMFNRCIEKHKNSLLIFLLNVGDEASKKEYLERANLTFLPQTSKTDTSQWIAASIGDESVIKLMSEAIPGMQSVYIEQNPVVFPDFALLKRLDYKKKLYQIVEPGFLLELETRGYSDELRDYVNEMSIFLGDFYNLNYGYAVYRDKYPPSSRRMRDYLNLAKSKYRSSLMGNYKSKEEALYILSDKKRRAIDFFRKYDPTLLLDICVSNFRKEKSLETADAFMRVCGLLVWNDSSLPDVYEWTNNNQEIVVEAIKLRLKYPTIRTSNDFLNFIPYFNQTKDPDLGKVFIVMLLLLDDVFHEHFSSMDKKCMNRWAVATGTYFNADWPYESVEMIN